MGFLYMGGVYIFTTSSFLLISSFAFLAPLACYHRYAGGALYFKSNRPVPQGAAAEGIEEECQREKTHPGMLFHELCLLNLQIL